MLLDHVLVLPILTELSWHFIACIACFSAIVARYDNFHNGNRYTDGVEDSSNTLLYTRLYTRAAVLSLCNVKCHSHVLPVHVHECIPETCSNTCGLQA